MSTLTPELLKQIAQKKIFSMEYKREDGTFGKMTCRFGVKSHLKDPSAPKKPVKAGEAPKTYVTVFNLAKRAYRRITIQNIISVRIKGVELDFRDLVDISIMAAARSMNEVMENGFEAPEYHAISISYEPQSDERMVA